MSSVEPIGSIRSMLLSLIEMGQTGLPTTVCFSTDGVDSFEFCDELRKLLAPRLLAGLVRSLPLPIAPLPKLFCPLCAALKELLLLDGVLRHEFRTSSTLERVPVLEYDWLLPW